MDSFQEVVGAYRTGHGLQGVISVAIMRRMSDIDEGKRYFRKAILAARL